MNLRRSKKIFLILIFSAFSFFPVFAEEKESSLKISPPIEIIEFKDETIKNEIVLENNSEKKVNLSLSAAPYIIKDEEYNVSFDPSEKDNSSEIVEKIRFKNENGEYEKNLNLELAPNEKKAIKYQIDNFNFAEEQRCIIFAETKSDNNTSLRVASILVLDPDDSNSRFELKEIKIPSGFSNEKIKSEVLVENNSKNSIEVETEFVVESIFGKELKKEEGKSLIFPDKPRKISFAWEESPNFGIFKVKMRVGSEEKTSLVFQLPFSEEILPIFLLTFIVFVLIIKKRNKRAWSSENKN